jgi:hypothetical protein
MKGVASKRLLRRLLAVEAASEDTTGLLAGCSIYNHTWVTVKDTQHEQTPAKVEV